MSEVLRFVRYAHDNYNSAETVDFLVSQYDWDEEVAWAYTKDFSPMYEVEGEFEYDVDTGDLSVLGATINGVHLIPEGS